MFQKKFSCYPRGWGFSLIQLSSSSFCIALVPLQMFLLVKWVLLINPNRFSSNGRNFQLRYIPGKMQQQSQCRIGQYIETRIWLGLMELKVINICNLTCDLDRRLCYTRNCLVSCIPSARDLLFSCKLLGRTHQHLSCWERIVRCRLLHLKVLYHVVVYCKNWLTFRGPESMCCKLVSQPRSLCIMGAVNRT